MTDLEISIVVGSVVSASFFIGCILGEALFRAVRQWRADEHYRRQIRRDRTCHECHGDDAMPVGTRVYRCVDCDRELGGE